MTPETLYAEEQATKNLDMAIVSGDGGACNGCGGLFYKTQMVDSYCEDCSGGLCECGQPLDMESNSKLCIDCVEDVLEEMWWVQREIDDANS